MQELNKGGTKNLKYSNISENISLWGIFLDSYQQCGKMGWSLAQDCRFILRLTIYTLAKWAFYIFSNVHTKLFTGVSHFVTFTCIHVLSPQVGRTSTRWRDGQKTYERGESGRQTRPGNDRSWADATCLLHLLQSCKARWEQMKFWSGNKSLLELKLIAPMQIWQSTIFHPDGQIAFVCQNWTTSWKGLINISWHVFIF